MFRHNTPQAKSYEFTLLFILSRAALGSVAASTKTASADMPIPVYSMVFTPKELMITPPKRLPTAHPRV